MRLRAVLIAFADACDLFSRRRTSGKSKVLSLMHGQTDLLERVVATVVPKHPFFSIEDGKWFIASIGIPGIFAGKHYRVGSQSLPAACAIG